MQLRGTMLAGVFAALIVSLGGCDDFKSNPNGAQTANAVSANAVSAPSAATNAQVTSVAPSVSSTPSAQARSIEPDLALASPLNFAAAVGSTAPAAKAI